MNSNTLPRHTLVGILVTGFTMLIVAQMIRIQTSENGRALYSKSEREYVTLEQTIYPERGIIYDRWGHPLASNKEVYEVAIDRTVPSDPTLVAQTLAPIVGRDFNEIYAIVNKPYVPGEQSYVPLAYSVSLEKITQLENAQNHFHDLAYSKKLEKGQVPQVIDNILWRPRLQRTYPEKALASNIIGFFPYLNPSAISGFFGIEQQYNQVLAGTPVVMDIPLNPTKVQQLPKIPPGVSLMLTIDRPIQVTIEQILDKAVETNGAKGGVIVVLDPKTGEVLGMASNPRVDPNKYDSYKDIATGKVPYNRAVGDSYEPGSVFKVLTMAAALDKGAVKPDTEFIDQGVINVGGFDIYNWDHGAWGPQTMTGCMQHSLNVCLSWVALQTGAKDFYRYIQEFGIGRRTGIDLADEINFPLSIPGDPTWGDNKLATNSFGQSLSTTPIQMISAVSAVANNGKIMTPHILKAYIENGQQRDIPITLASQPIKAKTAKTLTNMLAESLEKEASSSLVKGYRMAGKTGTAEIFENGGYNTELTNASFVGWGPADDPRFVVYVWLEKPTTSKWGSVVAAPVFSQVVSELVTLMKIPPDETRQLLYK